MFENYDPEVAKQILANNGKITSLVLNTKDIYDEMLKLANFINEADILYYVKNAPILSDEAYDSLYQRLEALQTANPDIVVPNSPVGRVRSSVQEGFVTKKHSAPMISLRTDVTYTALGCVNFFEYCERELAKLGKLVNLSDGIIGELKYDGLGLSLKYDHGVLTQALTRGDGKEGEDVTQNAFMVSGIPHVIDMKHVVEVRGEVMIPHDALDNINKTRLAKNQKPYVNCRNAAAGSLRNLDPLETKQRGLIFRAYELLIDRPLSSTTQFETLGFLKSLGFGVSDTYKLLSTPEDLIDYWENSAVLRKELPFDIDGVVFKLNNLSIFKELGYTSSVPRGAVACKFVPEEVTSVAESIEIQVGRTGKVTPVAKITPVFVGGVTVSSVTLHNQDQIDRLNIDQGDTVIVRRAGDVIPEITKVISKVNYVGLGLQSFQMPTKCPCCNTTLVKDVDVADIICPNKECSARVLCTLEHYVSRPCMNIDDIGPELIKKLYTWCNVRNHMDLHALEYKDFTQIEGMTDHMINKIMRNLIDACKEVSLNRFIASLGIVGIGQGTSRDLGNHYGSLEALLNATPEDMIKIDNVGPETVEAWFGYATDDVGLKGKTYIKTLASIMNIVNPGSNKINDSLAGKTVLFTGSFEGRNRDELKEHAVKCGGKVVSGVSKNLNYLVVGNNPGDKESKAAALGVKIIDIVEYIILTS